jgi:hypothetical protein
LSVAAAVQPVVAVGLAAAGRDRGDSAEPGEGRFGGQPVRVVAGADQQRRGGVRADAVGGKQLGCDLLDQAGAPGVEHVDLLVEVLHPA